MLRTQIQYIQRNIFDTVGVCPSDFPFPFDKKRRCCNTNIRVEGCPEGARSKLEVRDNVTCCDQHKDCPFAICTKPSTSHTGARCMVY